jgi:hypothetical protein
MKRINGIDIPQRIVNPTDPLTTSTYLYDVRAVISLTAFYTHT